MSGLIDFMSKDMLAGIGSQPEKNVVLISRKVTFQICLLNPDLFNIICVFYKTRSHRFIINHNFFVLHKKQGHKTYYHIKSFIIFFETC